MTRPTARVLTLLELLQSGGLRTLADLSERLGVDARTVRRYVQHLVDLDIPVESVRGRHGGYRLARGHRLPPLMFTEEEALAVLLGLSGDSTSSATAAAKLRRVLPAPLQRKLDAVRESLTVTTPAAAAPDGTILLTVSAALRDHQPIRITYGGRERTLHPYGLVRHHDRWYVSGLDPEIGAERTFRLDRVEAARPLPGTFPPPSDFDPAARLLAGFATAAYRHAVRVRVQATADHLRSRLPAGLAVIHDDGADWVRVDLHAERLDWVPALLAAVDRPFIIEQPPELRILVAELADRLAAASRRPEHPRPVTPARRRPRSDAADQTGSGVSSPLPGWAAGSTSPASRPRPAGPD
ncbi:transcriptional regulator [Actinoplanes sp. SE50]|uniref:helix-turn-helix transcriptional regulator n=1 Tax=unclassified Actinoplanes TaxID=2626549 RepID=UPI00023ECD04|nr:MULTISPECIES: YafY family protein [unclassified Actinoplanes]AEV85471.1 yobV-like uncharacterized HTH-type transcriptional regulator [Actinoplanes sp. SE50/110]ATO83864.1 transcriptional regulator [Actinoplanes sp. SE50]SLM01274.1 HTH-type 11 domain containing transcriptional regulator [Actinoplanes sp. SE50/110]